MADKNWLIGTLLLQGKLRSKNKEILLTTFPKDTSQKPEAGALIVKKKDFGKTVLVRGDLAGNVLYSAKVIEVLPHLTSALMQKLEDKGIVSLMEIQEHLHELEKEGQKPVEPKKLCALVIGHKKASPGAVNEEMGLSEFDFNDELSIRIDKNVRKTRIQRVYRRTYDELPGDINSLKPDFILSLHCNAYNGQVSGTEVLYYHRSKIGKRIAEILQKHLVAFFGLRDRGIKEKTAEDRGGYLLRYTNVPCVIAEPFFIDNDQDLAKANENLEGLAVTYAGAIDELAQVI